MRVSSASSIVQADTQKKVGSALLSGESVTIPLAKSAEFPALQSYFASSAASVLQPLYYTHTVELHPSAVKAMEASGIDVSKLVVGTTLGVPAGIGVGLILEAVKPVFSHNPLAVTLGFALLGGALGAGITAGFWQLQWNGKEVVLAGSQ